MFIPAKYKEFIGSHGFPSAASIEEIIDITVDVGDYMKQNQPKVVEGYQNPLLARFGTTQVDFNKRGAQCIPPETKAYKTMLSFVKDLGPMSCMMDVGFLAEEKQCQGAEHDAYWTLDPLCKIQDFIDGGRDWSVSIGFAAAGVPTGGVIYYPVRGEVLYTADNEQSYRRYLRGEDKESTALEYVSHDLELKKTAGRATLVAEFARQMKFPTNYHSPDVLSNVALKAISSRVANQDRVVDVEMPFMMAAPK